VVLASALKEAGGEVTLLDGAVESFHWLIKQPLPPEADQRTRRVFRKGQRLCQGLTNPGREGDSYKSPDRFRKDMGDLTYLAQQQLGKTLPVRLTPCDLEIPGWSPLKTEDLLKSYHHPRENPYFPWFSQRLQEILPQNSSHYVGMSLGYLSQALTAFAMMGFIRQNWPRISIILGGGLVTSWLRGPGDTDFLEEVAHHVVEGEGVAPLLEIIGLKGRGPGIKDPGDLYNNAYFAKGKILPYSASIGCSWRRCTFCNEHWEGGGYHTEPVEVTLSNLERLVALHKPALIHLTDSEISPELLKGMVQHPPGAPWYSFSRFFPVLTQEDFCRSLAESGCKLLCLGLESGDQEVLRAIKKGIHLDQVREILKNLKAAGIQTFVYIMFGTPPEDRDAACRTRDFILEMKDYIDYLNVAVFSMPITSKELSCQEDSLFYEGNLALYKNFDHPKGFSRKEVRQFIQQEIRGHDTIRKILKRTPPYFTSSHAPFWGTNGTASHQL